MKIKFSIEKTVDIKEALSFIEEIKKGIQQLQRGEGKVVYGGKGAGSVTIIE